MQALLSILPIALIVLGCGNTESKPNLTNTAPEKDPMESAVEWSKLQNRNGDAYIPNTDKPYSGWAKQKYDNEQVKVLAEFTDGSVTRLRQWQENGIPKWDIGYTQGKVKVKDVPIENFYDSNFSHRNGPSTVWYENGQKRNEGNFKDGKPNGPAIAWYENGQKDKEINFNNGKLVTVTAWNENGQKVGEANFKDGKPVTATGWYENGQKKGETNLKDGKLVTITTWKPNGEKCPITNMVDGNGVFVEYSEDGTEKTRSRYKDGEIVED